MKTSEFIKRWNGTHLEFKASRLTDTAVEAISNGGRNIFQIDDGFLISGQRSFSTDEMILINGYLQTLPKNRKDEKKWVIPWGVDGSLNVWTKDDVVDTPLITTVASSGSDWEKHPEYQFTDSEIEQLKHSQSRAVAQAIDIVKELVSDD